MKQILTTVVLFFATVCMAQAPLVDTVATSRILPLTNTDRISPLDAATPASLPLNADSIARTYSIDDVVISAKSKVKRLGRDVQSHMVNVGIPSHIGVECGIL